MNTKGFMIIDHDQFRRLTPQSWESPSLNPLYEITIGPRCKHLALPFIHEVDVCFYALRGRVLFEVDGQDYTIAPGACFYVPAGRNYRFRGLEHFAVTLHLQAPSLVEHDWKIVADQIRASNSVLGQH